MRNGQKVLQSGGRPTRSRSNPHGYYFYIPRTVASAGVWHQPRAPLDQYRGRLIPSRRCGKTPINKYVSNPLRAVGRGVCGSAPCLRPSPAASLLTVSQCPRFLDGGVTCSIVTATPPSLLKCADELTRSRQIRTCYLKSGGLGALINLRGPSMALCCCIMRWKEMLLQTRKRSCRALHEYLSVWLAAWC